jgi:hypothetical protein
MHPFAFLLMMVATGTAMVDSHPAANTPAAQFWVQALPGTPMPEAIADLVQEGILAKSIVVLTRITYVCMKGLPKSPA